MLLAKAFFFGSMFMLFYVYLGYPAIVFLLASIRNRRVKKAYCQPHVTIVTAAYNEEEDIGDTIKNKLSLDYPRDKLEIIIVSDGSSDRTDEIVRSYESEGVRLIRQEPRSGKTAALNRAVPEARGEIIVFSDANSIYEPDAVKVLVQNFSDPTVGYVTGKMIYTNPNGTSVGDGCTSYMKYENFLRIHETKLGSIVGVDGGIDALRKHLYRPMNPDQLPDFVLPLKVVEQGYRVVYDSKVILREPALNSPQDEYRMRVRVALRAFWALWDMRHLLNFRKYPMFTWELISHKWLRYLSFIFLVLCFSLNLLLWISLSDYQILMLLQSAFYLIALLAFAFEDLAKKSKLFFLPYYFTLINLSSARSFIRFISGQKQVIWTPRKG